MGKDVVGKKFSKVKHRLWVDHMSRGRAEKTQKK